MMRGVLDLREHVRDERRRRGWSVRQAATAGGCSNTTWGEWEDGKRELGPAAQRGVAQAFGWPIDWPDHPPVPEVSSDSVEEMRRLADATRATVEDLRAEVARLASEVARLRGAGKRPPASTPGSTNGVG